MWLADTGRSPNRTCVTCGKPYYICRKCEELSSMGVFTWKASCDTPECFQTLLVINDFYYGKLSKEEAREFLNGLLTDDMKPYDVNAAKLIEQIYEDDILDA